MFKKAQAAMEFLMTYGWAILVVLVVIGALAYFGVLSPSTLLPEKCTFPIQISCSDQAALINTADNELSLTLVLQNGAGRDLLLRSMTATGEALTNDCYLNTSSDIVPGEQWPNGATRTVILSNDSVVDNVLGSEASSTNGCAWTDTGRDKERFDIVMTYSWADSQSINHQFQGEAFVSPSQG